MGSLKSLRVYGRGGYGAQLSRGATSGSRCTVERLMRATGLNWGRAAARVVTPP